MRAREHDLGMYVGQARRFFNQLPSDAAAIRAARQRRRAKGAVLVAAVLNSQHSSDGALMNGRRRGRVHAERRGDLLDVGASNDALHGWKRAQRRLTLGQRGGASHDHAPEPRIP